MALIGIPPLATSKCNLQPVRTWLYPLAMRLTATEQGFGNCCSIASVLIVRRRFGRSDYSLAHSPLAGLYGRRFTRNVARQALLVPLLSYNVA